MEKVRKKYIENNRNGESFKICCLQVEQVFEQRDPIVTELHGIENKFDRFTELPDPLQNLYVVCDLRESAFDMVQRENEITSRYCVSSSRAEKAVERRLNSPPPISSSMLKPQSKMSSSPKELTQNALTSSSKNHPAIKITIDKLRQRLSISPNRALETIKRINSNAKTTAMNMSGSGMYKTEAGQSQDTPQITGDLLSKSRVERIGVSSNITLANPGLSMIRTDRSENKFIPATTVDDSRNERSRSRKSSSKTSTFVSGLKLSSPNMKSNLNTLKKKDISPKVVSRTSPDKILTDSLKRTSHNIYLPSKDTKKSPKADEVRKNLELQKGKMGGVNRSSTPNARDGFKTRLTVDLVQSDEE